MLPEAYYIYTATVGPVSRKRSQFSKTQVNFLKKAQLCMDIVDQFNGRLSPTVHALITARAHRNRALHVLQSFKAGRFCQLLSFVKEQPSALFEAMGLGLRKILRRALNVKRL